MFCFSERALRNLTYYFFMEELGTYTHFKRFLSILILTYILSEFKKKRVSDVDTVHKYQDGVFFSKAAQRFR